MAEPKIDYINEIAKKYAKKLPSNFEAFDKRFSAYKDFYDPDNQNIEAIAREAEHVLTEGDKDIRIPFYKDLKDMFDYNNKTHKAGKRKLASTNDDKETAEKENKKAKKKIKGLLRKHIETTVERYAGTRLDKLKEEFKGDKLNEQIEMLYCNITGLDYSKEKLTSDGVVENLLDVNYDSFRDHYDGLVKKAHAGFSHSVENQITGHLIQDQDKTLMANELQKELKGHPDLDTVESPHHEKFRAQHIAETFRFGVLDPEMRNSLKPEQLKGINLKVKKKNKTKQAAEDYSYQNAA